jgi:hypothetical protein
LVLRRVPRATGSVPGLGTVSLAFPQRSVAVSQLASGGVVGCGRERHDCLVVCHIAGSYIPLPPYRISNPFGIEGNLRTIVDVLGRLGTATVLVSCVLAVISVFVRLQSARGEERQQIKWFAYAAAVLLSTFFLGLPLAAVIGAIGGAWAELIPIVIGVLAIPAAVGVAMLRYRLYDIDRIINRTLVYGSLTLMLALVYFSGVTVTQALFQTLTGQERQPQLLVVASTLLIAALFTPLRRRIQSFIDRRFYRRKYDARKTLESFSAQMRNETDLEALSDDLVGVVRETMQPAHVSLWLRPETAPKGKQAN